MRGPRFRLLAAFAALFAGSGCKSCKNDHPYVPAEIEAGASAKADGGSARVIAADSGVELSVELAPGTTSWKGDGLAIEGGAQEIVLVLARDFDGDGRKDALAILRPPIEERKPGSATGQLIFVRGGDMGRPGAIAVGPPLGQWPACVATARLEKVGPRSAFAEIGSICPKAIGTRSISVVRLGGPVPAVAFDALVTDPKDASKLGIEVDVADRDGDGVDDTVLHLSLDGVEGKLAFFDRPAGPSRDPEEPEASLKSIAARMTSTKTKAKDMPGVVDQMRALYRAICDEGGAPRITQIHGGPPVSCGTSKALEDAGIGNLRALAQAGDVFGAFYAADIAQAPPATRTASRAFEIDKYLTIAAPAETAKSVKTLRTSVDAPFDGQPAWGPLAFEGTKLLVRSGKTVTSVDPESGDEAADSTPAWPSVVFSPDAKRKWTEAYQLCEGGAFRATFFVMESNGTVDAALPFPPPLRRGCTGHGEPILAQPIAWGARGLEAIVAGRPVLIKDEGAGEMKAAYLEAFLDEKPPQGSPRSGARMAAAVSNALLVRADGKWTNVRSPDFAARELRACVIDESGTRVACVRQGKVVLIQR